MALIEIRDVLDNETGKTIFPRTHVKAVIGLEDFSFFEKVQDADDPTKFSVKLKSGYTGLWTEGWLAAGGVGSGSGGGGGASYLNDLLDVDAVNPSNGQSLIYDSAQSKWIPGLVNTGGVSLSLSPSATYLTDSNGRYLKDSTGKYIVTSGTTSSINLLDASGTVLSSVSIPSVAASSFLTEFVPASRRINGHDLSADVTLNASDIGLGNVENTALSSWSGSSAITTLGTISSGSIPLSLVTGADDLKAIEGLTGTSGLLRKTAADTWSLDTKNYVPDSRKINGVDLSADRTFYVGTSQIQSSSRAQDLTGISSVKASSDAASMFAWDANLGAWHFYGNVYADGWMAAGGVGSGSGGGGGIDLDRVWQSLTNNTDKPDVEINIAHIPTLTAAKIPSITTAKVSDINTWVTGKGLSIAGISVNIGGSITTAALKQALGISGDETPTISSVVLTNGENFSEITVDDTSASFYTKAQADALIPTKVSQLTNDSGYVTSQALNTTLAGYATNLALAGKQDKYPFTITGTSGATYALGNFVTIDGAQTITGAKTFSGGITMSGANILPSADDANSLGSNDYRFNAAFIRNIYTSFFQFRDGETKAVRGNIAFGDGYLQLSLAGTNAANYMFYSGSGFFKQGGGVPLGRSDHRWSSVYSVDADLSGDLALASTSHIDIGPLRIEYDATHKALHITKKDSTDTETYGLYADGFVAAGGVQQNS